MERKMKRILGILLSFVLVVGMMPTVSLADTITNHTGTVTFTEGENAPVEVGDILKKGATLTTTADRLYIYDENNRYIETVEKNDSRILAKDYTVTKVKSQISGTEREWFVYLDGYVQDYIWVGGIQVTEDNAANITGEESPTAYYDAGTRTLTLKDYHYSGHGYCLGNVEGGIVIAKNESVTIELIGENSITMEAIANETPSRDNSYGIYGWLTGNSKPSITIIGKGSLATKGGNAKSNSSGIYVTYNITFEGGTVQAEGGNVDVYRSTGVANQGKGITIDGGNLVAKGGVSSGQYGSSYGVYAGIDDVTDKTVFESGSLKATGNTKAIYHSIVNYDNEDHEWGGLSVTENRTLFKAGGSDETAEDVSSYSDEKFVYVTAPMRMKQTVTFKVVNGSWDEGEGEAATADKTVTLTGYEGDTLKLVADQIPVVGSKPKDNTYKEGSWDVTPSTETEITAATTYTYTYAKKDAAVVTNTPAAKTLTYTGQVQELVIAGVADGGEMQYALGTESEATEDYSTSIPTGTDAGTYYVWYKAVGDETHTDSEAQCITVTISSESTSSGGGSSSGGSSSAPSTPTTPTESYTVPVSSENTVNIITNISNGTAVVSEITQSDIDKIIDSGNSSGTGDNSGKNENTSITIDVSQAKSEVTSVQLSEKTVEKLTEAVKADNNVESVEIKMTNATIELDGTALSAVSEQAEGSSIKLVVEDTQTTKLNATQQESLKQFASAKPFQAYFESNGKEIHDFKGGKATVSIKFLPESGRDVKHYHMYYLPVTGAIERYVTRYAGGMLSFVTTHFSDYAIVYDETMENETGKDTGTGDGSSETGDGANTNADGTVTGDNSESGNVDAGDESQTDTLSDSTANGKTAYQNAISINKGLKVSQTGNKLNISWGKVSGADRYEVYAAYCGKKFGKNPVKIVTGAGVTTAVIKKLDGKKLNLKKDFKVYVVAYKTVSGKKQKLGKTIVAHVIGRKNAAYTNIKAIKLEKSKATIKKGKTWRIKATVVLVDSSKKMLPESHAATFRYASSNKKIATVNKNGKVKAKKKGTCYIWIYAKNGCAKKIKVTVQ